MQQKDPGAAENCSSHLVTDTFFSKVSHPPNSIKFRNLKKLQLPGVFGD